MNYVIGAIFFLLGLVTGKLLNVLADATTAEPGVRGPALHCRNCGEKRPGHAVIPLSGFLRRATRCRKCDSPVPLRVPIVELITGILFAYVFWRYGWSAELAILLIFCPAFITLFVTDLEHTLVPNAITYPGMGVALAAAVVMAVLNIHPGWSFQFPAAGWLAWLNNYLLNAVAAGLVGFLLFLLITLVSRGGMGFGDVKLAALMGLVMGLPVLLAALFIGIVCGGLVAAVLLITGMKKRKDAMPFGPFLCAGSMAALFWGRDLLAWYLGMV